MNAIVEKAISLIGTKEVPGSGSNPTILAWARYIGDKFPEMRGYAALYKDDDTAWCGLFMAYLMAQFNIRPPFGATDTERFLWAHSWTKAGTPTQPRVGSILVLRRPGGYHVALMVGETETHFEVIGGNQGNTVSRIPWKKSDLVAAVWPPYVEQTAAKPQQQNIISQAAFDMIVKEEVTSKAVYERKYQHPIWPGASSGITIGIGYDVGAGVSSIDELRNDWRGRISDAMIQRLATGIRVTGISARNLLPMDDVTVPWDKALEVFSKVTLPKYYRLASALPNFDKLSPDCKGALVSLVYNRGASFSRLHDPAKDPADRYREMRAIRAHMISGQFDKIPAELRAMKRLWPNMGGLINRRENEALLFEKGLKGGSMLTKVIVTTTVAVGTGAGANEAAKPNPNYGMISGIAVATVIVAIIAVVVIKAFKKK